MSVFDRKEELIKVLSAKSLVVDYVDYYIMAGGVVSIKVETHTRELTALEKAEKRIAELEREVLSLNEELYHNEDDEI